MAQGVKDPNHERQDSEEYFEPNHLHEWGKVPKVYLSGAEHRVGFKGQDMIDPEPYPSGARQSF
jgi:hypothetical protein